MRILCVMLITLIMGASSLFANSVTLINTSPFPLDVALYAADGTVLAQYSGLKPQAQKEWSDEHSLTNPTESQTPYTVIWTCSSGGEYSICTMVYAGSAVLSSQCQGNLICTPKKKTPGTPNSGGQNDGGGN